MLELLADVQLPRRAVPDAYDDDYREWDEEKKLQESEEDNLRQVQTKWLSSCLYHGHTAGASHSCTALQGCRCM